MINEEVKHGKWVKRDGMLYCSECNSIKPYDLYDTPDNVLYWECNYCRICGAKMDGEEKEKLPKKPIVNKSGRITAFKCPRCGNSIAYKVGERLRFSTLFENNICSCGQEIDWSDENDKRNSL